MGTITIQNSKVYDNGHFTQKELIFQGDARQQDITIDGTELYALPGFVDLHVHFREPGFENKETIASGSAAAAAGGYTTVCTMPNLNPVPHSLENLKRQQDIIRQNGLIRILPYASITVDQQGVQLSDIENLAQSAVGFSDDGRGIQSFEIMKKAMEQIYRVGSLLSAHCEDNALAAGGVIHSGKAAAHYGLPGINSESEFVPVRRDISLAAKLGVRYHICHISTAESVDAVRQAKKAGCTNITCEATPHQLALCQDDITDNSGRFKMNPPLRTEQDRRAIQIGLSDGTIDCIATDHAPHTEEEKRGTFTESLFGIVGLETAFPVCYTTLVKSGILDLAQLVKLMSLRPAEIIGLPASETQKDWVLVNTEASYKIDSRQFKSKGKSTPFEGMTLTGKVEATISRGRLVYRA